VISLYKTNEYYKVYGYNDKLSNYLIVIITVPLKSLIVL